MNLPRLTHATALETQDFLIFRISCLRSLCPRTMAITFSTAELELLTRATQLLVSPLDHPTVDDWRSSVNHELKGLLFADSAGFLLPVEDSLLMYSEEHDPAELAKYADVPNPNLRDGTTIWEALALGGVTRLEEAYGEDYDLYLTSAYYNEYAGANGAHDTLAAVIPLGEATPTSMASLQFWHATPDGRLFGEREVTLLRLLFPAFQAGIETQLRWGDDRRDLVNALDALGQAAIVCDSLGAVVHQTTALGEMLALDPQADQILEELRSTIDAVRNATLDRSPVVTPDPEQPLVREIRTELARYVTRGTLYGGSLFGSAGFVVAALELLSSSPRPDAELREVFGLTSAEIRVASLLASRKSNREIARELFISPHTARRHTEKVMRKLGVHSRSEVGGKILG